MDKGQKESHYHLIVVAKEALSKFPHLTCDQKTKSLLQDDF